MPFIPAVIAAGAAIGSAEIASHASGSAAKTQAQAASNALDFQKLVYGTQQQQIAPYLSAGTTGLNALTTAMPSLTTGFDPTKAGIPATFDPTQGGVPATFSYGPAQFQVDPGYQFALEQGQQAIQRSAAARGGLVSGGTLKDLSAYTTGEASQQYGAAYSRAQQTYQQNYANALARYQQNYSNLFNTFETNQQNQFSRLNTLANMGLSATGMSTAAGQNYANQAGTYTIGAGNALAAGQVGSANAWTSGLGGVASAAQSGYQAYQNQQYQKALLALLSQYGGGGASSGTTWV